jgi:hypothetical protein
MNYLIEFFFRKNLMTLFFTFFLFLEKFWMIPNDKYTSEGQIFILSIVTCSLHMKSTINLTFQQIWEFSEMFGYFQKVLAIFYAIATRYGFFGTKFELYN